MATVNLSGYLHRAARNGPLSVERIVDELEHQGIATDAEQVTYDLHVAGFADRGGVWVLSTAELEKRLARAEELLAQAVAAATNMKGEAKQGAKLEILGAVDDIRSAHLAHCQGRSD